MKKPRNLVLLGLLIVSFLFFGWQSLSSYLDGHSYYATMFSDSTNRGILFSALICSLLPVRYLMKGKHLTFKKLIIYLAGGLAIYGLIHSFLKGGTDYHPVGFGRFITLFNTLLLFALGAYTFTGFFALGSRIEKQWIHFTQHRRQEFLLTLGIGMIVFLAIVQILLGIGILHGIVSRILFLGLGFLLYWERTTLKKWGNFLSTLLQGIGEKTRNNLPWLIAISILLVLSVMYFYYGFQNAFIPYSTARDANHEYMYIPKILAENAGVLWGNTVGGGMPGIWHIFITFFFSLTGITNGRLGLSSSTIAVAMNFWSAVLVLLLGIGLVYQIIERLTTTQDAQHEIVEKDGKKIGIVVGRSTLLLWLTSGMGAFLVMVDNKTDLGVMALSLLALLAGTIFLGILQQHSTEKKEIRKYLIIAGVFFSFACLAKATAFVDIALFGIFLIGLWISSRSALGIGLGLTGILRYMNILTSSFLISEGEAKWLIFIGIFFVVVGILLSVCRKETKKQIGGSFAYLLVLGVSFLVPLLLFKAPWIMKNQFATTSSVSPVNIVKGLFAQVEGEVNLETQNSIDEALLKDRQQDANACLKAGYSEEELQEGLQEVKGSGLSEDVGRYIGFGWKEFTAEKNGVYRLIKLFFPNKTGNPSGTTTCYGMNEDAKLLCNYGNAIDTFDIALLKELYEQITNKEGQASLLLKDAIDTYDEKFGTSGATHNPQEFRDQIVALRQYYQSHSIKSDATSIAIPYRYLIPLNITFNWSLQNLSSYYTDIGFTRIFLYIILIISLPYALIKRDKKLITFSLTTLIGWGIWWVIGGGILRYGTVLISRTIITVLAFANKLYEESKNTTSPAANSMACICIGIVLLGIGIQIVMNFMRISSQGANGPFVRYKGNVGEVTEFTDTLEMKKKIAYGYTMKNVFNLQFPQYNAIITALKDRNNEEGVVVAGTYIQYFLDNQWNLQGDGMLTEFWVKASDGNLCKTYRRLKNDNIKYLIIDPNIGTVGMGEGNETLFHRFFAKLNAISGTVEEDGTLTTLVKMYQLGYLKLLSTNNIGAYYAFNLTDAELTAAFGARNEEELILLRAKLIGIRYFSEEVNTLFNQIGNLFVQRILANQGIEEIASILGAEVDTAKINAVLPTVTKGNPNGIADLTQTERTVLIQYLNLYQSFTQNSSQASELLQNLLMASIGSSSQVMAFELI